MSITPRSTLRRALLCALAVGALHASGCFLLLVHRAPPMDEVARRADAEMNVEVAQQVAVEVRAESLEQQGEETDVLSVLPLSRRWRARRSHGHLTGHRAYFLVLSGRRGEPDMCDWRAVRADRELGRDDVEIRHVRWNGEWGGFYRCDPRTGDPS